MISSIRFAWLASGPTRAISRKVRGVCRKPTPWPVAGESMIDEVVGPLRALGLARLLRQLPDLAHRHHLRQPRRRRGQVVEERAAPQQRSPSRGPACGSRGTRRPSCPGRWRATRAPSRAGARRSRSGACRRGPRRVPGRRSRQTITRLAALGRGESERVSDGRLADPALAGYEGQPLVQQVGDSCILAIGGRKPRLRSRIRPRHGLVQPEASGGARGAGNRCRRAQPRTRRGGPDGAATRGGTNPSCRPSRSAPAARPST